MEPMELARRLYRGGFNSRQAGDIVIWMAEPFKYDRVPALATLEDYYEEADRLYAEKDQGYKGIKVGPKH